MTSSSVASTLTLMSCADATGCNAELSAATDMPSTLAMNSRV